MKHFMCLEYFWEFSAVAVASYSKIYLTYLLNGVKSNVWTLIIANEINEHIWTVNILSSSSFYHFAKSTVEIHYI